jgi:co-chaperonin GroES (HSP10)
MAEDNEQTRRFLNTQRQAEYLSNELKYQNETVSKTGQNIVSQNINGEKFDIEFQALNSTVVLKKELLHRVRESNGIIVPDTIEKNTRTDAATVVSKGEDVIWDDLKIGDRVMFDTHAVFRPTFPICWLQFENIIAKLDKDDNMDPIGDFLLVEEIQNTVKNEYDGLLEVPDSVKDETPLYKVHKVGPLVTKAFVGDVVMFRGDTSNIHINLKGKDVSLVKEGVLLGIIPD